MKFFGGYITSQIPRWATAATGYTNHLTAAVEGQANKSIYFRAWQLTPRTNRLPPSNRWL